MYNERLFVKASKGLYIAGLSESEISESSQEITTSYQVLSQKLLGRYAQIQVSIFTFKIREYVAHPLLVDQVTVVSPIWRNIQSKMEEIHLNVRNSFKEETKLQSKATVGAQRVTANTGGVESTKTPFRTARKIGHSGSTNFDNIMDTLDKLFDERLVYLPQQIELKAPTLMASISKSVLKVRIVLY
jgi:hypothetical protein